MAGAGTPVRGAPDALTQMARAASELRRRKLATCFDPSDLESRPTEQQQAFFDAIGVYQVRPIFGGNRSGKSACPARELGWIFTETHPTWVSPWAGQALTVIIAVQDLTGAEAEIWNNKLRKFLDADDWKPVRQGQTLKRLEHRHKGHQIIFLSHANSSEADIAHMQQYTAHYVWVDEAPRSRRVLEELFQRVSTTGGYFVPTMTIKRRDNAAREVRSFLEHLCDGVIGKLFRLSRMANPRFAGQEEIERKKWSHLPKDLQEAIFEGLPVGDDLLVYDYDPDRHLREPTNYRPTWRHVLSVDPATESKFGISLWAEDPRSGCWYCVMADYIEGVRAPSALVRLVESRVEGFRIVKRIYDPAASWYAGQAREMGYSYRPIRDKSNRSDEMRAALQEAMGRELFLTGAAGALADEFGKCQRSETTDRIANASKYHLIDTAKYFWDAVPPRDAKLAVADQGQTHDDFLIEMDDRRRRQEHVAKTKKQGARRYTVVTKRRAWR